MMVYLLKETIKIRNNHGFYIPLLVPSYKKSKNNDGYLGVLNVNGGGGSNGTKTHGSATISYQLN
jgi:hypothetical protein